MRYLSVCSGIEAASVAWHPLGWQPVAFSEIEAFPSAVLAQRWPHVPNWGDMERWRDWPGPEQLGADIDLLVGGTPCQSFSVAGLRKGLADPRGNLALTYLAIADRYRPRWLLWENVPGVLSSDGGRDFGALVGAMVELGYGVFWRVLDAQYCRVDGFGRAVPQRRRRVFVVGYLGDWRRAAAVLLEPEGLPGNPPPRRQAGQGTAGTLAARSGGGGWPDGGDGRHDQLIPDVSNALAARDSKRPRAEDNVGIIPVAHALRAEGFDASEDGTGRGTPLVPIAFTAQDYGGDAGETAPTLRAGGHAGSHANAGCMPAVAFAENSRAEIRLESGDGQVAGALKHGGGKPGQCYPAVAIQERAVSENPDNGPDGKGWRDDGAAYTVEARQVPQAVASTLSVRRLTPVECERLQAFPDGYTAIRYRSKPTADGPRYKALGNSMAVNVMRWIGRRIDMVEALAEELGLGRVA